MFRSIVSRALLAVGLVASAGESFAAVTTVGAVPNAPPAGGGAVVGPFTIGDGAFGSVTVTGGTAITNSGGATLGNLVDGIGVVSLNGFGSDWTLPSAGADIVLADEGVGQITVSNLARLTVTDDTFIGSQSTASGKLTVSGLGSVYDNGDDLQFGVLGSAIVEVLSGGALEGDALLLGSGTSGRADVTVSGDLSRMNVATTVVGSGGFASLTVADRGRFTGSGVMDIGDLANSVGRFTVSGATSLASSSGLNLGVSGTGRLSLVDGGRFISSTAMTMATNAASVGELVVSGTDSRFRVTGSLTSGAGEAYIQLAESGVLSASVGYTFSATTRVELAGGRLEAAGLSNTAVNISGTVVGSGTIDAQGVTTQAATRGRLAVEPADKLLVTGLVVNNGLLDLNGGELEIAGTITNNSTADIDARNGAILRVGGAGLDNNGGSQLSITGGEVDVFGAVVNDASAEIAVVGGSTGIFHDAVTNTGTIFVSASSEIVLLENLSFVPGSALSIQLATSTLEDPTEEFGLVDISGAASIAGGIKVSLASGYAPTLGDTFEVLTATGGRTGTFATESLPTLGAGLALDVQYTPNSVVLAVVSTAIPGDYNANGVVDAADYTRYRDTLGTNTTLPGDTTPGTVTAADYTVWKNNFGATASAVAAAAVPEPNAVLLAALLLATISVASLPRLTSGAHE